MRYVRVAGLVAVGAFLVFAGVACSSASLESSSPAGPSGLARAVSPGPGAMFQTDHTPPPDEVDTDVSPCTGEDITIFIDYVKAVFRPGNGFSVVANITTSDGFSGSGTFSGIEDPTSAGNSGVVMQRFRGSATLRNGTGQVLLFVGNGLFIMKDGNIIIDRDEQSFRCVGKPVA